MIVSNNDFIVYKINNPYGMSTYAITSIETSYPIPLMSLFYHEVKFKIEFEPDVRSNIEIIGEMVTEIHYALPLRRILGHSNVLFGKNNSCITTGGMVLFPNEYEYEYATNLLSLLSFDCMTIVSSSTEFVVNSAREILEKFKIESETFETSVNNSESETSETSETSERFKRMRPTIENKYKVKTYFEFPKKPKESSVAKF